MLSESQEEMLYDVYYDERSSNIILMANTDKCYFINKYIPKNEAVGN